MMTYDKGGTFLVQGGLITTYCRCWTSINGQVVSCNNNKNYNHKKKKKTAPSSGSAFFVDNRGHIITNYHVVETCNNKSKIKYNDREYNVNLIAKDKYLDLALLKADINNNFYISISNEAPYKLQKIIAAGYPFGKC